MNKAEFSFDTVNHFSTDLFEARFTDDSSWESQKSPFVVF